MNDIAPISLAIDTNFISNARKHPNSPSAQLLGSDRIQVFTSATCFAEIGNGKPEGEEQLLIDVEAVVLGLPTDSNAIRPDSWNANEVPLSESGKYAEDFLIDVFRKVAGTKSDLDLSKSLLRSVEQTMKPVETDLQEFGLYGLRERLFFASEGLCCTNRVRDSSRESSVVAGMHEQTHTPDLQDQKLASLQ
ncbi:hypothetical protein [Tropicibacter oceani]|uniref:Uncharacterized protein n=1 Tax=Tropicibacter oceani TaxID=3058420 RepID=A0ABY8QFT5_9RHOB|nr:hypothetical protein [Tropicibacter oceani]WGW03385.1 hypothetical protein QF118_15850 [Tropicibacter oceani]